MNGAPVGAIDHFVLAVSDLERTCQAFESATGVRPAFGGAHAGRGTHNALVAFDSSYLEIIAPDPAQSPTSMSTPMARLAQPTLMHWAVRCSGLQNVSDRLRTLGWTPTQIRRMSRTPPNAARLEWELFGLREHRYGGIVPFFIDWLDCPHPAATSPRVGALLSVQLRLPDPAPLRAMADELGVAAALQIEVGDAELTIAFDSRRGSISYSGRAPAGFTLGD